MKLELDIYGDRVPVDADADTPLLWVLFLGVLWDGKLLNDFYILKSSRKAMFDDRVWWARALKLARNRTPEPQNAA